jgi:hypothetical protein
LIALHVYKKSIRHTYTYRKYKKHQKGRGRFGCQAVEEPPDEVEPDDKSFRELFFDAAELLLFIALPMMD